MPDLKGSIITLHCLIYINVIQLQQDGELGKYQRAADGERWKEEEEVKRGLKIKRRCYIKNLTFIMFLKTYACVSVLLSLLGLQIIQ